MPETEEGFTEGKDDLCEWDKKCDPMNTSTPLFPPFFQGKTLRHDLGAPTHGAFSWLSKLFPFFEGKSALLAMGRIYDQNVT